MTPDSSNSKLSVGDIGTEYPTLNDNSTLYACVVVRVSEVQVAPAPVLSTGDVSWMLPTPVSKTPCTRKFLGCDTSLTTVIVLVPPITTGMLYTMNWCVSAPPEFVEEI